MYLNKHKDITHIIEKEDILHPLLKNKSKISEKFLGRSEGSNGTSPMVIR